ncbi:MAG: vWA domain-containing protein [Phycisphaerales bacterium]
MNCLNTPRLIAALARSTFALSTAAALLTSAAHAGGEACRQAAAAQAAAQPTTQTSAPTAAQPQQKPVQNIDLAICLDTSGSMQGLIDSARARIWDVVSDLARATPAPKLRVALLTYGNDGYNAENGWTKVDIDLSDDLDNVSKQLFALTTNGGTELVARAVDRATRELTWTQGDTLKIILVAGNESADQDQTIHYQDASKRAIEKGILVNSIYCGNSSDELVAAWKEVARLADGRSACIDQTSAQVNVDTPYDQEILAANATLNTTYLPYGAQGAEGCGNQTVQDTNARNMSGATLTGRAVAKCSSNYWNAHWDLVDACKDPAFKLEEMEAKDLPESMRTLKKEERRAFVAERGKQREEIQSKIKELDVKRAQFIANALAARPAGPDSFDRALRDAIRAQATARGLQFADAAAVAAGPQTGR